MIVSAVNTHPNYVPDYWRYQVTVDGVVAVDCIFASEEGNEAICLVCDEHGIKQRAVDAGLPGPEVTRFEGKVIVERTSRPVTERYSRHYLNIFGEQHRIVSAH